MKTVVYVDGFNLYYGCLKGTPYRWLDLRRLCEQLLPGATVVRIKYFTAHIHPRASDPGGPNRQQIYLRALATLREVDIILGHFRSGAVTLPLADGPKGRMTYARVLRYEEEGSDVNLAAHLIHDGHRSGYEMAVVISNDSDLGEALRLVRRDLGLPVGLLNPHPHSSTVLRKQASFYKPIRAGVLRTSQFPDALRDEHGPFTKPLGW